MRGRGFQPASQPMFHPASSRALFALLSISTAAAAADPPPAPAVSSAAAFIPAGFVIVQTIRGDLNNDGQADDVHLVKGTDQRAFVQHTQRGRLDRNRRGLVIVFNLGDRQALALSNPTCFSSENEDGGVYFAPELDVGIHRGKLQVQYGHGRYGGWSFTFRHRQGEFALIGYDSSENRGPVTLREVSMNLLTGRARLRVNANPTADPEADQRLKESWTTFVVPQPIVLRTIQDFDALDIARLLDQRR